MATTTGSVRAMTTFDQAAIDRLSVSWTHRGAWRPVALLGMAGVLALLEATVLGLDHGTHLLVALAAVLAMVLVLGPKPAVVGLVLGALVAGGASLAAAADATALIHASVQLLSYLFVGGASIALVAFAARSGSRFQVCELQWHRPPAHEAAAEAGSVRHGPADALLEALTPRELEILRLATSGASVDEMARRLCISPNTVKTHLTHVYAKLGVRGRTDAVRAALHSGCLTPHDICPHVYGPEPPESPVPVTTPTRSRPTI